MAELRARYRRVQRGILEQARLKGLREDRLPIPEPSATAEYVEVGS